VLCANHSLAQHDQIDSRNIFLVTYAVIIFLCLKLKKFKLCILKMVIIDTNIVDIVDMSDIFELKNIGYFQQLQCLSQKNAIDC